MPKGRKKSENEGRKKPFTLADYVELYSWDLLTVDGIIQAGMFKGMPWWYSWISCDHPADENTDEGYEVYVLTDAERAAFSELKDAYSVTLNTIDHRLEKGGRGFSFEVIKITPMSEGCATLHSVETQKETADASGEANDRECGADNNQQDSDAAGEAVRQDAG
jgi:hypothetical protein